MEHVATDDQYPDWSGDGVAVWSLSDPLGTSDVVINRYRVAPGEELPAGLHAHPDQEELFVVLSGRATFEVLLTEVPPHDVDGEETTLPEGLSRNPDGQATGEVTVGTGETVRFAPGEFQSGRNDGAGELVVLAVGAPPDSEEVVIPVDCPACGRDAVHVDTDADGVTFVCPDCGAERVPSDCPECGGSDLVATLVDAGGTGVVCRDCSTTFETVPVEDPA